jgi:signal transduction histidine kinase
MQPHILTVFLILGFLYVMLPVAVWLALSNQLSKTTVVLWCIGAELLAVGLVLFGLRPVIPAWVSYPFANAIAWTGILIQALALRHALNLKSWRPAPLVFAVAVGAAVFEYFRVVSVNSYLRFSWSLLFFISVFAYIAHLAWRIGRAEDLKSGRLLAMVYSVASALVAFRLLSVFIGSTEPDVVAQGLDSLLVPLSGFVSCVLGAFAFTGMFFERANKNELRATEARVRQEESFRLSDQISQLERQRTLGAMSYSFAHEFSQPMTAILMDAHTIKDHLSSSQVNVTAIHESIDDIERNANRTAQLIDRIRNFIRPTHGDFERVDMKLLIEDVLQLLSHDIRAQHVVFEWDIDPEACIVVGDKVQLSQIVLNVYRNAIQALAQGVVKKIYVSLETQNQRVVLRVRDTGAGLDDALQHQVGEPFVTTKKDGLGVGLSISKTIAEKHNASLSIANALEGGAIVELNLPAAH